MSKVDVVIAIGGGWQSIYIAGDGISMLSGSGQAIAGVVSAVGRIGGAIAVNSWCCTSNMNQADLMMKGVGLVI